MRLSGFFFWGDIRKPTGMILAKLPGIAIGHLPQRLCFRLGFGLDDGFASASTRLSGFFFRGNILLCRLSLWGFVWRDNALVVNVSRIRDRAVPSRSSSLIVIRIAMVLTAWAVFRFGGMMAVRG